MSRPTFRFRPTLAALAARELPSAVLPAAPPAATALPSGTYTGPLGGVTTVASSQTGATITETLKYVGPNGRTVTAAGTFTVKLRTGVVTGIYTATGPAGRTVTGTVTVRPGQSGTAIVTGPNGKTATVAGPATATSVTLTLSGPGGQTFTRTLPRA